MPAVATWNILVVEDQPGDVHLIRMCTEDLPGIVLYTVPNAVQAHSFLQRRFPFEQAPVPDLILLDLRMPIFEGSAVLETVRDLPDLVYTPVVVFTSSNLLSDQRRCKGLGAADYVIKPTDWPAWQGTILAILRKHLPGFVQSV
jgi:two-component system response regulator